MNLEDIIFGKHRRRILTEGMTVGGIICPLIKLNQWDVLIYGGGEDVSAIVLYFLNLGIRIKAIFDCDAKKDGSMILGEVPVLNPYKITEPFDSEKTIVIVNTWYFKEIEQYEILSLFSDLNIKMFYNLTDYEKNELKADTHIWTEKGRIQYYYEHYDDLQVTYQMLYDLRSKKIMLEFIRTYMECDTYRLDQCSGDVKYFYGQCDGRSKEEIYTHLENEVWVNAGACIGDNIFWYFANGLNAKAIYAYESNMGTYTRLTKNMEYLPEKYSEKVFLINEFINSKTDWDKLNGEKITLINADIEGEELNLLKSMQNLIKKYRPVLAICVYHKPSDLVEIPKFIKNIVKDYCFILRKYETNTENVRRSGELVLYAVPVNRISEKIEKDQRENDAGI